MLELLFVFLVIHFILEDFSQVESAESYAELMRDAGVNVKIEVLQKKLFFLYFLQSIWN